MNKLAVIGVGGHTRSSVNLLNACLPSSKLYFFDDGLQCEQYQDDFEVSGGTDLVDSSCQVFLSIGDNNKREHYFKRFSAQLLEKSLQHPKSFCEIGVSLGVANQLFAFSYINSGCHIGDNNIINSGAIVEHETTIGNHNHISVGAKLCGRVTVGNNCFIGAGAVIKDRMKIANHVVVGAGAVIVADIVEPGTYVGMPARKLK